MTISISVNNKPAIRRKPWALSICQPDAMGEWHKASAFCSVTHTPGEISVICNTSCVPPEVKAEHGWTAYEVQGPLPFDVIGVMAGIASVLAENQISIFAVSTYNTDYILLKEDKAAFAEHALRKHGHDVA